jgi:hypothetical protein
LWVKIARNNLVPVRERIVFFKDGQEFLPGVQAMFTPGHTKMVAAPFALNFLISNST